MAEKSLLGASPGRPVDMVSFPKGIETDTAPLPPGAGKGYDNSSKLRRLNPDKYPGVKGCCEDLLAAMLEIKGFFSGRPSDLPKLQHHVEFFVVNLYHVYQQDPLRWVSYSRNKNEYGKKSKYKDKFKLSHEYSVNKVLKFLLDPDNLHNDNPGFKGDESSYISHSPFVHVKNNPTDSRQSRIRSTPKLIDLIIQHQEQEGAGDGQWEEDDWDDYEGEEPIVVKGLKPPKRVVYRMRNGVRKKETFQPPRKICKTPDSPHVRQMRENLQKINALMDRTDIKLDVAPEEYQRLNENLRGEGNAVIDLTKKKLHRVFLDRRLDRGGRFYGPWYQGIPKEYREHILINGSPVCEPDFSGYHPRMLYAMKGLALPEDPYRLEGYPDTDEMRSFLKPLLLMIVNAKNEQGAIRGMRKKVGKDANKAKRWGREIVPLGVEIRTDAQYREVMGSLMHRHEPIKEFFFTEMGSYLQHLDSQIAEAVMLHLADNYDQAVLPVHDSFIVDFRFASTLRDSMNKSVEQALKQPVPVKRNEGGLLKRRNLALNLATEMIDRFVGSVIEAGKDLPETEGLVRAFEKALKEVLESIRQM